MNKLTKKMTGIIDNTIARVDKTLDGVIKGDIDPDKGRSIATLSGKLLTGVVIRMNMGK
jgi:hypothetical protein